MYFLYLQKLFWLVHLFCVSIKKIRFCILIDQKKCFECCYNFIFYLIYFQFDCVSNFRLFLLAPVTLFFNKARVIKLCNHSKCLQGKKVIFGSVSAVSILGPYSFIDLSFSFVDFSVPLIMIMMLGEKWVVVVEHKSMMSNNESY